MNRFLICVALLAICVAMAAPAAAKTFQSTWVAPDAKTLDLAGKKVAVLVVAKNRAARATAEELLVKKITALGPIAVPGSSLVTESEMENRETVKAKLAEAGVAGALIMHAVPAGDVKLDSQPWENPDYRKFLGYTGSMDDKGKKVPFYVEVFLYSMAEDRLVWTGRSATKAVNVDQLMTNMMDGIVESLQKDGLIKKAK